MLLCKLKKLTFQKCFLAVQSLFYVHLILSSNNLSLQDAERASHVWWHNAALWKGRSRKAHLWSVKLNGWILPSACSTAAMTAGPPWMWNSTLSSPVKLWGADDITCPNGLELTPNHQVGINKKNNKRKSDLGTKRQVHDPGFPWSWGLWCCVTRRCGEESGCVWAQPDTSELWMKLVHWLEPQPPHTYRGQRTGQRCSQH